jgi:hypothetical protein
MALTGNPRAVMIGTGALGAAIALLGRRSIRRAQPVAGFAFPKRRIPWSQHARNAADTAGRCANYLTPACSG